ncbi:MAG: hypothetical protein EGQ82_02460, partial [Clostridiales bacterium]|nr:hypothetical protein [Clostridiales bacterium]
MMIRNDMKKRMEIARAKVTHALELGGGHTILSTGMTGDDARMARAVCEAGVKMLEPNHPGVALARGHKGVVAMHASEQVRHEITMEQMAEVTRGVRAVCPKDTYITVAIPGGFTEIVPLPLTEADFQMMALAGADGLHTHKSSIEDLEELVTMAHKYGLLVDAYIGKASDLHTFGLPAETPEEVAEIYKKAGYDVIAITDHWNHLDSGRIAGLRILSGAEYNIGGGDGCGNVFHILGIGCESKPALTETAGPQEIIDEVHRCKGL